jgi:hypothetical protein
MAGQQPLQHPSHPDRLLGQRDALQLVPSGPSRARRVALVEDQVQHVQDRAEAGIAGGVARQLEDRPRALIVALARLIRCAIVASGTRNAPAILAVVRPPTARSVSAICDGAVSDS